MSINPPKFEWTDLEREAIRPRESKLISEWMEENIILSDQSEEKGRLRMSRTPYIPGIVDSLLKPLTEEVVFCKPAQIAGTTMLIGIEGYYTKEEPCPIALILADEATANFMGRERVQKMIEETACLREIARSVFNKNEVKLDNGAYLATTWASSVPALGSRPFKVTLSDEIDKPGYYAKSKEASALSLIRERGEAYYLAKRVFTSTPTLETGNITVELRSCDVIFDFHIPCPFCGVKQPLRWSKKYADGFKKFQYRGEDGKTYNLGQVHWVGGRKATPEQIEEAGYQCGSCGEVWSTVQKNIAVESGTWVPRTEIKHTPRRLGFHLNRLYSLLGQSGNIPRLVRNFVKAVVSGDPKTLQGFVNSTLAEPWKFTLNKVEATSILRARADHPARTVPEKAVVLTCGIDNQKAGKPYVVRAWAPNFQSWLVDYGVLTTWDDVNELLFRQRFKVNGPGDKYRRIWRAGIDTGGTKIEGYDVSMTEEAYFWLRRYGRGQPCKVWGTKGANRPMPVPLKLGKPIDKAPSGRSLKGSIRIVRVDASRLKDMFFYRLGLGMKGGDLDMAAYLNADIEDHPDRGRDYLRQITAEEKRIEDNKIVWKQIRPDNHFLDAECIALACALPEWEGGGVNVFKPAITAAAAQNKTVAKPKQRPPARKQARGQGHAGGFERPGWMRNR